MSDSTTSTSVRPDTVEPAANDAQAAALGPTEAARQTPAAPRAAPSHTGTLWRATAISPIDAAKEATYWRDHYRSRPYAGCGANHDDFGPAYAYALHAYRQHAGRPFDSLAETLAADWPARCGRSSLNWAQACPAVRDAWERLHAR
jgi:hypothetical protein